MARRRLRGAVRVGGVRGDLVRSAEAAARVAVQGQGRVSEDKKPRPSTEDDPTYVDKKPGRDSQSSVPVEIPRRNVDKIPRPAELPRAKSPPVEAADESETLPIVMSPALTASPLA